MQLVPENIAVELESVGSVTAAVASVVASLLPAVVLSHQTVCTVVLIDQGLPLGWLKSNQNLVRNKMQSVSCLQKLGHNFDSRSVADIVPHAAGKAVRRY